MKIKMMIKIFCFIYLFTSLTILSFSDPVNTGSGSGLSFTTTTSDAIEASNAPKPDSEEVPGVGNQEQQQSSQGAPSGSLGDSFLSAFGMEQQTPDAAGDTGQGAGPGGAGGASSSMAAGMNSIINQSANTTNPNFTPYTYGYRTSN